MTSRSAIISAERHGWYAVEMSVKRPDFPPVGHPLDYLLGLVAVIVLIGAILASVFIVSLLLPA